jgi:hypothetical protein
MGEDLKNNQKTKTTQPTRHKRPKKLMRRPSQAKA